MYYVSTMTYPYEGLLMNEYQKDKTFGNVPGNSILESLGIGIDTISSGIRFMLFSDGLFFTESSSTSFFVSSRRIKENRMRLQENIRKKLERDE